MEETRKKKVLVLESTLQFLDIEGGEDLLVNIKGEGDEQ